MNFIQFTRKPPIVRNYWNGDESRGIKTSTLWNTIEWCRGFEDMKGEISSSLKATDIFGLIFTECATFGLKI